MSKFKNLIKTIEKKKSLYDSKKVSKELAKLSVLENRLKKAEQANKRKEQERKIKERLTALKGDSKIRKYAVMAGKNILSELQKKPRKRPVKRRRTTRKKCIKRK